MDDESIRMLYSTQTKANDKLKKRIKELEAENKKLRKLLREIKKEPLCAMKIKHTLKRGD